MNILICRVNVYRLLSRSKTHHICTLASTSVLLGSELSDLDKSELLYLQV